MCEVEKVFADVEEDSRREEPRKRMERKRSHAVMIKMNSENRSKILIELRMWEKLEEARNKLLVT